MDPSEETAKEFIWNAAVQEFKNKLCQSLSTIAEKDESVPAAVENCERVKESECRLITPWKGGETPGRVCKRDWEYTIKDLSRLGIVKKFMKYNRDRQGIRRRAIIHSLTSGENLPNMIFCDPKTRSRLYGIFRPLPRPNLQSLLSSEKDLIPLPSLHAARQTFDGLPVIRPTKTIEEIRKSVENMQQDEIIVNLAAMNIKESNPTSD